MGGRLLYISPVVPALTGNGLAMRAGAILEALARRYQVHLLVARLYPPYHSTVPEPLAKLCRRVEVVPQRLRERVWDDVRFDVVHVFRLALLRFSRPYLRGSWRGSWRRPRRHLDLDDIESITRRRIAALYRRNGESERAAIEESEAARTEGVEAEALRRFDRVYVCSELDAGKLAGRARAAVRVLPNAVRIPGAAGAPAADGVFRFLFAGTLGYYPNEDAARYLCAEIVPRIGALAGQSFAVNIVGTGAPKSLALDGPSVRLVGEVEDLAPWYAQADAVLAPLRAGGGTRIKVLEAFSYQRPVVATTIGMEGIEALPEEDLLIGDTPEDFARQCARLIADRRLGERLARHAHALWMRQYTIEALVRRLEEIERPRG